MMLDIHEMRRLLGNNLRSTREAARLSQKELAGICFVPDTSVSRVERGEQQPKLSTLALFSLAMGVPLTTSLLAGLDQWLLDL
jgi:transcriptional regulator with XRE-family HTH domain